MSVTVAVDRRSPGCFFWVLPKLKPDPHGEDIQQELLGTDMLEELMMSLPYAFPLTVFLAILSLVELNLHPRPCPRYSLFWCCKRTLISQPSNNQQFPMVLLNLVA